MYRKLIAIFMMMLLTGCGVKYIEGTKIIDNEDSRKLILVVEKYRKAMEKRDAATLASLASKDYFEKNGNNNSRDNYDYDGLVKFLNSEDFSKITSLKLKIFYKEINIDKKHGTATIRYFYSGNYRKPPETFTVKKVEQADGSVKEVDNKDQQNWYSTSDDNEMHLQLEKGKWKIISGM